MNESEFLAGEAAAAREALRSGAHVLAQECTPQIAPHIERHPWRSVLVAGASGFLLGRRKLRSLRFVLKPLRFLGKAWLEVFALAKVGEQMAGHGAPAANGKQGDTASKPPEPVAPSI